MKIGTLVRSAIPPRNPDPELTKFLVEVLFQRNTDPPPKRGPWKKK